MRIINHRYCAPGLTNWKQSSKQHISTRSQVQIDAFFSMKPSILYIQYSLRSSDLTVASLMAVFSGADVKINTLLLPWPPLIYSLLTRILHYFWRAA